MLLAGYRWEYPHDFAAKNCFSNELYLSAVLWRLVSIRIMDRKKKGTLFKFTRFTCIMAHVAHSRHFAHLCIVSTRCTFHSMPTGLACTEMCCMWTDVALALRDLSLPAARQKKKNASVFAALLRRGGESHEYCESSAASPCWRGVLAKIDRCLCVKTSSFFSLTRWVGRYR